MVHFARAENSKTATTMQSHPVKRRRMSIREPIPVGSEFGEYPQALWELLVDVEFDPGQTADAMAEQQRAFWDQIIEAVEGAGVAGDVQVEVMAVRGRGETTPLFPMVVGSARYTSALDIVEVVERLCQEQTQLSSVAYDAAGRAYELDVEICFRRRPEHDGQRRAELPRLSEVAAVDWRRRSGGSAPVH